MHGLHNNFFYYRYWAPRSRLPLGRLWQRTLVHGVKLDRVLWLFSFDWACWLDLASHPLTLRSPKELNATQSSRPIRGCHVRQALSSRHPLLPETHLLPTRARLPHRRRHAVLCSTLERHAVTCSGPPTYPYMRPSSDGRVRANTSTFHYHLTPLNTKLLQVEGNQY